MQKLEHIQNLKVSSFSRTALHFRQLLLSRSWHFPSFLEKFIPSIIYSKYSYNLQKYIILSWNHSLLIQNIVLIEIYFENLYIRIYAYVWGIIKVNKLLIFSIGFLKFKFCINYLQPYFHKDSLFRIQRLANQLNSQPILYENFLEICPLIFLKVPCHI